MCAKSAPAVQDPVVINNEDVAGAKRDIEGGRSCGVIYQRPEGVERDLVRLPLACSMQPWGAEHQVSIVPMAEHRKAECRRPTLQGRTPQVDTEECSMSLARQGVDDRPSIEQD